MSDKLLTKVKTLEEQYSQISDNMIDAIYIMDAKTMKFEYITPSFERVSGYLNEEFLKLSLKDILTSDSCSTIKQVLAEERKNVKAGKQKLRKEKLEFVHKDGSSYWIEIKAKYVKEKNNPLKIVGIAKEISQQVKHEKLQVDVIKDLSKALAETEKLLEENRILKGLLPICSSCKRIRDHNRKWWPFDLYVSNKTKTDLTHTVCPDCSDVLYGKQHE